MATAIPLPRLPLPPIWNEGRFGLEAARLYRSPVWRGDGVQRGEGHPVLLIPGFLAGDGSLGVMTHWLRRHGYWTSRAGIRSNVGCSATISTALERRLEELANRCGRRVTIVGQSRGGTIGRALAVRRPDLVSGLVTLGSPLRGMLDVHPFVLGSVGVVAAMGTLRVGPFFTFKCLRGECCKDFRTALEAPCPEDVGLISIYSRRDGIVNWRACLDSCADEHVEIQSSHCGMAVHPDAYRAVADALAAFRRRADAFPGAYAQAA